MLSYLWVYPRVCGGTCTDDMSTCTAGGLSPRVRGNLVMRRYALGVWGSIPACAGEPVVDRRSTRRLAGLSPRVRGNPPEHAATFQALRSIPACAGEPVEGGSRLACRPVYPRVCGGTALPERTRTYTTGLSPRVRGNLVRGSCLRYTPRSIPACAGEPPSVPRSRELDRVYPRVCGGTAAGMATCRWG